MLGTFVVTCYALQGTPATGDHVHEGGVAVDPSVSPLGSRLHIEGVGWRVANDTGGTVDGHHLDIWKPSTAACNAFGAQRLVVSR